MQRRSGRERGGCLEIESTEPLLRGEQRRGRLAAALEGGSTFFLDHNYNVRLEKLVDVPHGFKAQKSQRRERENYAVFAIALVFAAMTRSLDGTIVEIDNAKPTQLMVRAEQQFQTFAMAKRVVIDRESSFAGDAASTTARIDLSDLTPGEYVRLQIDPQGHVTHVRAVVRLERAKVRSVSGSSVVLEDGTTLTISSVLRFVNERGKPSATATVRPGESVLLFHHPETRNIYRFSAEPRSRRQDRLK